jgi:FecR protein
MTESSNDRLLNAVAEIARQEQLLLAAEDISDPAFAELSDAELQALAGSVSEQLWPVQPAVSERQRPASERQRARLLRPQRGFGRRLGWLAAAAALFGASVWLVQYALPGPEPVAQQQPAARDDRHLTLPDGSTLALGEQAEAHVVALTAREVRVQLDHGSVECEVAHDPERRFVVAAGGFEVVVKGTHFTVSSQPDAVARVQVAVSVERGLVEVRQPPDQVLALLGVGQRWSSDGPSPAAPVPIPAPPPAPRAIERESGRLTPAPARAPRDAVAASARELFDRANAERLAGHAREAAAAFDELRRSYPNDSRAGYAAFMLGRIRLDSLADANGAAEAFAFAIAHPGGGYFLEDAEARRVEALAKAGRAGECRAARDQFLVNHPQAVRAAFVAQLCSTP